VTLAQVAAMVRAGEDIQVFHQKTNEDLTASTLALLIFEEECRKPKLSVRRLAQIIRTGQLP
jgi:polyhydroxyalkanoate synthesis regulator protein